MSTIDTQIDHLISEAQRQELVTYNRYKVGTFTVAADLLPEGLTLDKHGLYDATIMNGNGCAQVRKGKRGPVRITFNGYGE